MKYYLKEDIIKAFDMLPLYKKNKILDKALKLALNNQAGTYEYAIARSMGYHLEDDGGYTK